MYCLCRLCCSNVLFVCKCVLYYCHRVSTKLQLTNIRVYTGCHRRKRQNFGRVYICIIYRIVPHHITSRHVTSCHVMSYHIIYNIISYIISFVTAMNRIRIHSSPCWISAQQTLPLRLASALELPCPTVACFHQCFIFVSVQLIM
jgi:hypothetical protein